VPEEANGIDGEQIQKSLVPKPAFTDFDAGAARVAELADALDSGSSE
jgi:hypothetical protein